MGKTRRGSRKSKRAAHIEVVRGSIFNVLITAATSGQLNLQPQDARWGRLVDISEVFNLYRFTRLDIEWLTIAAASDSAVGVIAGVVDLAPATTTLVGQTEYWGVNYQDQTTPTRFSVPRSYLIGETSLKWWKTVPGTPDDWNEIQGIICGAQGVSGGLSVRVDYEIEFCSYVNVANTPKFELVDGTTDLYRRKDSGPGEKQSKDSLRLGPTVKGKTSP